MDAELNTRAAGVPELMELGKRIEMLRIERGLSKQHLARFAGTSRQQLWRVMTGKSELTGPLRERLAEALHISSVEFSTAHRTRRRSIPGATISTTLVPAARLALGSAAPSSAAPTVARYIADASLIERTLRTLPAGSRGLTLKRRVLEAIEDIALDAGLSLGPESFELRRRVLAGEL
jgi:transcriptional regulator with XRE-family HTH domain